MIDLRIWGKARGLGDLRYPLACHLLDAGAAARLLWDRSVPPGLRKVISQGLGVGETHAGALVAVWAALHDIGKITPQFQSSASHAHLPGYPPGHGQLRHDEAAHKWLQAMLPRLGYAGGDQSSPSFMLAQLIGGHHGTFHAAMFGVRPGAPLSRFGFADDRWQEQRYATFRTISGILGSPEPPPELDLVAAVLVCAIIILADWLVSQDSYLKRRLRELPQSGTAAQLRAHFDRSLLTVRDLLTEAGLAILELNPGSFCKLFPQITEPNALQCSVSERLPGLATGPGLLLITAPPGLGKTETGLYAARIMGQATGRPGLYMALPTMATADQMFLRVLDFARDNAAGDAPLTLLHSMAWLNTQYISEEPPAGEVLSGDDQDADPFAPTDWLLGPRRGICAPWAVGTGARTAQDLAGRDTGQEAAWRERALNAEDALKAAHAEIAQQRKRIDALLGRVRDLEAEWTQVRPMMVVMRGVTIQHGIQVPLADDEHPVGYLGPGGEHQPFRISVGPHRQIHPIQMTGTDGCG
jgi:CRISPR-associated endonuclease/helicase Cas3